MTPLVEEYKVVDEIIMEGNDLSEENPYKASPNNLNVQFLFV